MAGFLSLRAGQWPEVCFRSSFHSIVVNTVCQEHLEGISLNLAQTFRLQDELIRLWESKTICCDLTNTFFCLVNTIYLRNTSRESFQIWYNVHLNSRMN